MIDKVRNNLKATQRIIDAKTQGSVFESVVLPPINLMETIKTDSVFNVGQ